jgi:hypothetical protein
LFGEISELVGVAWKELFDDKTTNWEEKEKRDKLRYKN